MSSGGKTITVVDRFNKQIAQFSGVLGSETVEAFKKRLLKDCEVIRKKKIGAERIRLTVGDQRGVALADR
jgi:hypothetical protein